MKDKSLAKRMFVSDPPREVILIWADSNDLPELAGATVVYSQSRGHDPVLKCLRKFQEIASKTGLTMIVVQYSADVRRFLVEDKEFENEEFAHFLADNLGIKLGSTPAKRPNNPERISDPFHVWSRLVFDGASVKKVDLDALVFSEDRERVEFLLEIKRSAKIAVGKWTPYIVQDYANYVLDLSLCKTLGCQFMTVHHSVLDGEFLDDNEVDVFEIATADMKDITSQMLTDFASPKNRSVITGQELRALIGGAKP